MLAAEATPPTTQQAPAPAPPVSLTPAQVFTQQQAAPTRSTVGAVVGTILGLGLVFGIGAIHGQWAYGDWTCAFKTCVAVAPVRRRKKR